MNRRTSLMSLLAVATIGGFGYHRFGGGSTGAVAVSVENRPFREAALEGDFDYPFGIAAGDLDRDGDLDLTATDARESGSRLFWYENRGGGTFTRKLIEQDTHRRTERHKLADLNGDGWLDVVVVQNFGGDVEWFENPGPRLGEGGAWTPHYVTRGELPFAYDLDVGDIDGDGRPDLAASSWFGNRIVWFANRGGDRWEQHLIDTGKETRGVSLADFDGDGRLDVLGVSSSEGWIRWYERIDADHWRAHPVDSSARPCHGHAVDFDGDGDPDVVMAFGFGSRIWRSKSDEQIAWLENEGHGRSWKKHVIDERFGKAFEAVPADLDGDGDLDVAATAWGDGTVAWFENPGDRSAAWRRHVLKAGWPRANQIIAADLDGDGRVDLAAAAERGVAEVRWWRNLGGSPAVPAPLAN